MTSYKTRANRGASALAHYIRHVGLGEEDEKDCLVDLVTDLLHLAEQTNGTTAKGVARISMDHFDAENDPIGRHYDRVQARGDTAWKKYREAVARGDDPKTLARLREAAIDASNTGD